jgi:transposase
MRKPDWQVEGSMDQARRGAIVQALAHCNQNVGKAANRLRISRSTMYRLMEKFEVEGADRYGLRLSQQVEERPTRPALPLDAAVQSEVPRRSTLVHVDGELFLVS